MKKMIEVCANSVESAVNAQLAGADRVELCAGMPEGGTTPSYGTIRAARERLHSTRLHVIIRPRGGDFLYSPLEQDIMLRDIEMARSLGADGVVFGCLTAEGDVDVPAMKRLMAAAEGMSVTFHRAFDMCREPLAALERLVDLGVSRVLTSGQRLTAELGIPLLKELVRLAAGRIIIMPGCGVNADNIRRITEETDAVEFHLSGRVLVESGMVYRGSKVSMGGPVKVEDYRREVTDIQRVRAAISALRAESNTDVTL